MTAQSKINIGHHARVPHHIIETRLSPTARRVWEHLALFCTPEKPFVWVNQAYVAKVLEVSTRTIRNALKELLEKGLLKFKDWYGRVKRYVLAWISGKNFPTRSEKTFQADRKETSYINKEENKVIEQHSDVDVIPDSENKNDTVIPHGAKRLDSAESLKSGDSHEDSALHANRSRDFSAMRNDKLSPKDSGSGAGVTVDNATINKLASHGVYENIAISLLRNYGAEAVENQLNHLAFLESQGKPPHSKGGWLKMAIERRYPLPEGCQNFKEQQALEERQTKRDAVFNEAVQKYQEGKYEEAKDLADTRQQMQYDFHLPSAELYDKCCQALKEKLQPTQKAMSTILKRFMLG
ncbi:helix-turn-helix domain-containing protein [Sulfobacillus acidophilus]|uniref:Helix-turn-helix domain-containing protein n=1 Tax=Sulfobacillus acidophilus TaxID=53633 RepID=A0ABS3AVV6_9FIRM|nr:helix-turn-helix domain-containing protein [Sulfobacillus acidophilus]